jgi:hypothetical protein
MTSLWMKVVLCPLIVGISSLLFPNVYFNSLWQPIIVGLILAASGYLLEIVLLREKTMRLSLVLDFIASILIVYFVSLFLQGAVVTLLGAILTAVILTLPEIPLHRYLINSGKTNKALT